MTVMNYLIKYLLFLLLAFGLLCGGCAKKTETFGKEAGEAGYTVIDARGKSVYFPQKPVRIFSNNVFADEILLDLVSHDRIAALSRWVHDPGLSSAYRQAEDIKINAENNLESIIALQPDLVLLPATVKPEMIMNLEDAGLRVYVYNAASRLQEISANVHSLGEAVGEKEQAQALIDAMEEKLAAISKNYSGNNNSERPSGLIFLRFGAIGGEGCIYNDILQAAGIYDAYNKARRPEQSKRSVSRILSKEEVVHADPDFFIMGSWDQGGAYKNSDEQLQQIYNDPSYADVKAVKNRRAVIVPQSYVNCLSHHVADGIEKLHNIVYGQER